MRLIENLSVIHLENYLDASMKWDIFLSGVSFEKRCIISSKILLIKSVHIGTSIIFNYKETDENNVKEEHLDTIKSNLDKISCSTYIFNSESVSLPSEGIKKFLKFIEINKVDMINKKIAIDITVLTKPYFFLLLKVMREKFNLNQFYIIYTEPEMYNFKATVSDEIILTEGLDRVESIPGFIGSTANSDDALIVILGFEGKRAIDVFNSVNPKLCYSINGFPSFKPGWHKISLEANLRFLNESGAFNHLFFAPAIDPFETKKVIHKIVNAIEETNPDLDISIAPLGTKVQAFGVLLYAFGNKSIRVIYPFPSTYNINYSHNCGPSWIFKVDLNRLADNSETDG